MPADRSRAGGGRLLRDRIVARGPDARFGEWLVQAGAWLRAVPEDRAWTALAALAVGEFEAPRRVLRALGERQDASGRIVVESASADGGLDPTLVYLLLSSRQLLWTGDVGFARAHWERVRRACHAAMADQAPGAPALRQAAFGELAAAAESAGDPLLAMELRRRVPAARLARLRGARWASAGEQALYALLSPRDQDPAAAWQVVLEELHREDSDPPADPTSSAALVAAAFVHGMLGVEPDAPRGRMVLRPAVPAAWSDLEVLRLKLGDADVALRYHRENTRHVFRIEQQTGAAPLRLIFEPVLPAPSLAAALVDGREASLDPRPIGRLVLVPLQVVLDHERVIELWTEA